MALLLLNTKLKNAPSAKQCYTVRRISNASKVETRVSTIIKIYSNNNVSGTRTYLIDVLCYVNNYAAA